MHGIADFIDVSGTDTLLAVGQPPSGRMLGALKVRHQRMHSGGGKQTGRIVIRNQRCTLDLSVTVALEKFNKFNSEFIGCHKKPLLFLLSINPIR